MAQTQAIDGRVTAVRGAVLDVVFEGTALPPIDDALIIMPDTDAPIIAEVQSHLDETTVQAIALQSTAGIQGVGSCHCDNKQIELLDYEPERKHGEAGAHPSEKGSLVGSMVAVTAVAPILPSLRARVRSRSEIVSWVDFAKYP